MISRIFKRRVMPQWAPDMKQDECKTKQKKKVQFDNNVIDKLNRIIKVFMSVEFFSSNELYHVMI